MCGGLNLGTIRKKDDPILNTQTDPIAYKEKMEEIKDGEKGAPMPSVTLYAKEKFLAEGPVAKGKTDEAEEKSKKPLTPESNEVTTDQKLEDEYDLSFWDDAHEEEGTNPDNDLSMDFSGDEESQAPQAVGGEGKG